MGSHARRAGRLRNAGRRLAAQDVGDELQRANLAAPYDRIYRNLVPTTALIESCWHQYVLRAGKVGYLRSAAGSVGIMQINQRVVARLLRRRAPALGYCL